MIPQPGILAEPPPHAEFLFLDRRHGSSAALEQLAALELQDHLLVALGERLVASSATLPGLRPMPTFPEGQVTLPSTPFDLMVRVSGQDPGQLLHRSRALLAQLPAYQVSERVSCFVHEGSRDLTGYEDGTENPTDEDALRAAFQMDAGPGLDGSSVLAMQRWVHDFRAFDAMGKPAQDHAIGRERISNEELDEAPESAHVKRTAQEDFEPEAFVLRRSMPWRDERGAGLLFLAFGSTLDAFEAQLRRMSGAEDGVVDALFRFTRPVTGATFWCPPLREDGGLDLSALS